MELQTIARRYAQALFNLGQNFEIKEFLATLVQLWKNPMFVAMVNNPVIPMREKSKIIMELFTSPLPEYLQNLIKLLCEKKRFYCIKFINREFNKLLADVEKINYIKLETAHVEVLPEYTELHKKLEQILNIKIDLKVKRNISLIAGAKITFNEDVIDGSFKAIYDKLHAALLAP
jgi:ATP synthase F1 delta subunit